MRLFARAGGEEVSILNVPPRVASRRLAGAAARALRVPERQPHLEGEIRAQEVWKVGAVGPDDQPHLVFAETQMVEQEIARSIAQHLHAAPATTASPRSVHRRASRSMRNTSFPSRNSMYCARARRSLARARPRRLALAHGDFARDRAALGRRAVARELRVPRPRGRRRDLGEPEIRRPAVPLARFGRDASIGRDQRKLALERLLRGEHDAQRRALPRRDRRGQDRELGRVFAGADWTLGLCVRG